jgi:uncharacterized membrane protein YhdT
MPARSAPVIRPRALQRWLIWTWWPVFPCFAAVTLRLVLERACADPYNLLPEATLAPGWAWLIALAYVAGHGWTIGAYLLVVSQADALLPPWRAVRSTWGNATPQLLAMLIVLIVEYAPITLWRFIGARLGCGP